MVGRGAGAVARAVLELAGGASLVALALAVTRVAGLGAAHPIPGDGGGSVGSPPRPAPEPLAAPRPEPVASYTLHAELDAEEHVVRGRGVIRFRNASAAPVEALYLHLYLNAFKARSLFLREATGAFRGGGTPAHAGGIAVERLYARELERELWPAADLHAAGDPDDETDARVPLPRPLPPGAELTLDVSWLCTLPDVVARTGFAGTFHMVAQWFPKLARLEPDGTWAHFAFHRLSEFYADFGDYDVTLDVPRGFRVGATGERLEAREEGGRSVVRHAERGVHDFAFAAWDEFEELTGASDDGVRITVLHPPGERESAEVELATAVRGLAHYGAAYGPYPYATLTVVHPPASAGEAGGMEYPTLITTGGIRAFSWLGVRNLEVVTAHELAHQWFYGLVANDEHRYPFLDEGLTSYATTEALEAWLPKSSALRLGPLSVGLPAVERVSAARVWQNGPIARSAEAFATGGDYGGLVYGRTATLLATLGRVYGAERVRALLGRYARAERFRHPDPEPLLAAVAAELGPDVAAMVRAALFDGASVDYAVEALTRAAEVPDEPERRHRGSVLVRRHGELAFPVVVALHAEDGSELRVPWDGAARHVRIPYAGPSALVGAVVDPDHDVLLDHDLTNNAESLARTSVGARTLVAEAALFALGWELGAW
ncbi:MAG: M1 family metallopeptidase [Polyangiaceae bacterium]|nr:M1 family metallopeptidase [Polyangiaceae bacterium]